MDNLTDEQIEEKNARIARGVAYEDIVSTDGFKQIQAFVEDEVRRFGNDAIVTGFKTMEEYQVRRGRVEGLRSLLNSVQSAIEYATEERQKKSS